METAIEHSSSGAEPEAFGQSSGMSCSILEGKVMATSQIIREVFALF